MGRGNQYIQLVNLFFYLGFYVAFNTVQLISRQVVGRAEETSTYGLLGFCTVNCRPTASNYQLSHLRSCWKLNPGLRGGRLQLVKFLYCKLPTDSKQLPAFPLEVRPGTELRHLRGGRRQCILLVLFNNVQQLEINGSSP